MAETYAYQQNFYEGASVGYVKYNATPDLGTPVAPGETVVFTGVAYSKNYAAAQVEIQLQLESGSIGTTAVAAVSISKATVTPFSITVTMPAAKSYFPTEGRTLLMNVNFSIARSDGSGDILSATTTQQIMWLRYRIHPQINQAEFYRYDINKDTLLYERRNDGLFCMCAGFRIALGTGYTLADITVARITTSVQRNVTAISTDILTAALTAAGYVEQTGPALFADMEFALDTPHKLTIEIGDAYDIAMTTVILPRAFANLCLANLITGGVSIGGFPQSALYDPRFDCFFPAYFHEGATGTFIGSIPGVNTYEEGDAPTGGIWIDGKEIYRYVLVTTTTLDGASGSIGTLPSEFDTMINIYGTLKSSDGSARTIPFAYYGTSGWSAGCYVKSGGDIQLQMGSSYSGSHSVVMVFEYTKND